MTLKKESSKVFLVNLFADFIISQIPHDEQSIIHVIDCHNFVLVKGKTTSKTLINLSEITNQFSQKFPKYLHKNKITHTLDLIEYDQNLSPQENITITYHNTDNCSYNNKQIDYYRNEDVSCEYVHSIKEITDDCPIISSEFPNGYSLGQGRLLYYYGKHIFYNIPPNYPVKTLTFNLSTSKDEDNIPVFSVYNNSLECDDVIVDSWVKDNFNFDMNWLNNEMKKVDWSVELTNPLSDYDFLKKRNSNFIII
jgi:hypothetical protein